MQTFAVHTDSVWTLLASPDFSLVYSGGRDNCVYRWIALLLASDRAVVCTGLQQPLGKDTICSMVLSPRTVLDGS